MSRWSGGYGAFVKFETKPRTGLNANNFLILTRTLEASLTDITRIIICFVGP